MSEEGSRTTVQTYVPAHQKALWKDHADRLDMSQSEFVRTMVQAGRAKFDVPAKGTPEGETPGVKGERMALQNGVSNHDESGRNEGALADRVVAALRAESYRSWEDLVSSLTADLEDRLESTLQDLQSEGRVVYSGRQGGYTLAEDDGR